MSSQEIVVRALREIHTYLELDGANPFKSGAFEKAARILEGGEYDLETAVEEGTLTDIPGIGAGIAEKISDIWQTGTTEELDALRARIPAGLVEMASLPGLGPKKIHAVHTQLGIVDMAMLEAACRDGRIAALKGFGEKTAEKILKSMDLKKLHAGMFRADVAMRIARPILEELQSHEDVLKAEMGGSMRRRKEVVKDIDFIASTENPEAVMEFFTTMPGVVSVIGRGETKSSIILGPGIQADLRCVLPAQFPWALHHFTGSREHNTAMRARAKSRGLKMNEYGLFPEDSEMSLVATSEADVFKHLGLPYIEPELRENMGEIEAAEAAALPSLITRDDIVGLPHMHTHYSDGTPEVADYAKWARARRIKWMGISDHSQSAAYAGGLKPHQVLEQQREIDAVNEQWNGRGVRLLKGIESDILGDGSLDYTDEILRTFEFVVASVHSRFNLSEDEQTARIIRAIENPYTTILAHPTGRLLLEREGYPVDQRAIINACARCGVAIEINANPMRLDLDWRLVHYAVDQGCYISIGPDAHDLQMLDHLEYGIGIARKGWVPRERVVNCLSAEGFIEFARKRRTVAGIP